jgi:DNA-binding transcriptional regulator YhcF (GntR family)
VLRAGISSGTYPPRTPLPSAKTLSQQHGIAVNTVMKAFDVLRAEGLVRTVPAAGYGWSDRGTPRRMTGGPAIPVVGSYLLVFRRQLRTARVQ